MPKNILSLTPASKKLWSKKTKERTNVDYILIAELPEEKEPFFASNIGGELEKEFPCNNAQKLLEVTIKGKKSDGSRHLELKLSDSHVHKLYQENFTLLVSCISQNETGRERMDNLLCFHISGFSSGITLCYFPDDANEQAALGIFQLSSVFCRR